MNSLQPIPLDRREQLVPLFAGHKPSFLMDTVLDGYLGSARADDIDHPTVAELEFATVHFYGGDATHPTARGMVENLPRDHIVFPCPPDWHALLTTTHKQRLIALEHWDFSSNRLDLLHLRSLCQRLPAGFRLAQIDLTLAQRVQADLQTEDHIHFFSSPKRFVEIGCGFCALDGERIVSAASSGAVCKKGIEVQVNTHADYRQQGLATCVAAALLVHCLEKGLEPHWCTGNPISVRLAEKLGYVIESASHIWVRIA